MSLGIRNLRALTENQLISQLRDRVRERLPHYFMPSAFVVLDKLPLTLNGKIDRRALPPPGTSRDENTFTPPRTPEEEKIAEIWSGVLDVKPIGVDDNFFDLGGHSSVCDASCHAHSRSFRYHPAATPVI